MPRLLRAALVLPTLVLAHQLVFLVRYGSIYGEALAHTGHGQAWSDAVAVVAIGSGLLGVGTALGLIRLGRQLRRQAGPGPRVATTSAHEVRAVVTRAIRTAGWLTALALVGLTIQENLEHAVAGLVMPGVGVLVSRDYPFAVAIVVGVSLAIALVATLLTWRRAVLTARLRALAATNAAFRRPVAAPAAAVEPARPRPGQIARQLGRRAPPLALPA
jgi:hypothetical protein